MDTLFNVTKNKCKSYIKIQLLDWPGRAALMGSGTCCSSGPLSGRRLGEWGESPEAALPGEGVSGLQPEKQKNEQQVLEDPGKLTADRWGRVKKPMCSRLTKGGPLLHQALLSEVQNPQTRSSYVLLPKGPAFPGLTSGNPTSPRPSLVPFLQGWP